MTASFGNLETETPYLLLDLDQVRQNVQTVRDSFRALNPQIYYSMKANAEPPLIRRLHELGCGFDFASLNELNRLGESGVPADDVIFSSTVKVPSHIAAAHAAGVDRFSFDSHTEVQKLARLAPGAKVIIRLEVPHTGSRWPLAAKFGVAPSEALSLLRYARESGLQPHGVTFHVGSQCTRAATWREAIDVAGRVWNAAAQANMPLELVNFGGGLPSRYTEDVPSVEEVGEVASSAALATFGPNARYAMEPGRFIAADAGTIVTTVIGKAVRKGTPWIFVDLSIYAGLLEVTGGWTYPIRTSKDHRPKQRAILAGPSCDSTDILAKDIQLPDLEVGDRVMLLATGAYTTAYRQYNGFTFPSVLVTEEIRKVEAA